jgi:hypothetical protein
MRTLRLTLTDIERFYYNVILLTMANLNTKRKRRALAKAFTAERKAGRLISSPRSKRTSPWRGALISRRPRPTA